MFPPAATNLSKSCPHLWYAGLCVHTSITVWRNLERVQSWNGKRRLQCPICEMSLCGIVTRTVVSKGILKLIHSKCISANPGALVFCVGCGGKHVCSPSRLWKQHCKCRTQKETNGISSCAQEALATGSVPSSLEPPVETYEEHATAGALIWQGGALPSSGV
jgi:hypothetical protein